MDENAVHVVTGAFGYSGKYIARRLLERGRTVRTLTNSPGKTNPFGEKVRAFPLSFGEPEALTEALRGAAVLYNTYWVRFNTREFNHDEAVRNSRVLF
jgi:NADH dehydrogenase